MTRGFVIGRLFLALTVAVATCCWFVACGAPNTQTIIPSADVGGNGVGANTGTGINTNPNAGGSTGINTSMPVDKDAGSECTSNGGDCYAVVDAGPYCGDGKISPDLKEDCDDGNRVGGDGCSGVCKVESNWTCPNPGQPCKSLIVCGDGKRQTGEGCDDGNTNGSDGCDGSCKVEPGWFCATENTSCQRLASCGDSRIGSGESCDLGGDNGKGKGCDANCRQEDGWTCRPLPVGCVHASQCGNRKVESGEDCDDGGTDSGDGCNGLCKIEGNYWDCPKDGGPCTDKSQCGNGKLEKTETCDDGNNNDSDGCTKDCKVEDGWQCRRAGSACVPRCGDKKITASEKCDDGNDVSDDGCSSTCVTEPGYACTGTPSVCVKSVCGNGTKEEGESCDCGNDAAKLPTDCKGPNGLFYGDPKNPGCSKTCTLEPSCRDSNGVTGACAQVCGDGNKDAKEDCDDGNQVNGDGCSKDCKAEGGFTCTDKTESDAEPCPSASSLKCLVLPVTYRDFNGQQASDGHPDFFYYGAPVSNGRTTGVVSGANKTTCVPNAGGTKAAFSPGDGCPSSDASGPCKGLVADTLGKDGKPVYAKGTCPCIFTDWDKTGLLGTCPTGGDDAAECTPAAGITGVSNCWLTDNAGTKRLRVEATVTVIQSKDSFAQWYTDSSTSTMTRGLLELAESGGKYQFSSSKPGAAAGTAGRTVYDDLHDACLATPHSVTLNTGFFPLEDKPRGTVCNIWPYWLSGMTTAANCCAGTGCPVMSQYDPKASWDNCPATGTGGSVPRSDGTGGKITGMMRNFYFTTEVRYLFRFDGTAGALDFFGDDDVWVFVNGKLALDLGAPHERLPGTVTVDKQWGLSAGNTYEIAIFHADRHPRESNYQLTLSAFNTIRSVCQPRCGDKTTTAGEECDNGEANQDDLYDGCTKSCKFGPFCGDGEKNGSEECDDGQNTTVTSSADSKACGPGCKLPPRCGDKIIQTGEECDDGSSNTDNQCGGCSSQCKLNPYCGDGKTDKQCGEECDDGVNIGGYSYCKAGCKPDSRCGDKVVDADYGETCDLGEDKNGVADSSGKVECTSTCGVPAVCGDKIVTPPETCDDGVNDGGYGGCTPDCQHAPYCGDGAKNGPAGVEECDYGDQNTPPERAQYGGCLTTCKLGPRCGDKITQNPPELCDTGGDTATCSANCVAKVKIY
jgi:fibro-slime domain-containing protein